MSATKSAKPYPSVAVHNKDYPSEELDVHVTTEEAREHIADFLGNTNRLGHHIHNYPTFDARELMLGKWLGKGGFSDVDEIREFLHIPKATRLAASAPRVNEIGRDMSESRRTCHSRRSSLHVELGYEGVPGVGEAEEEDMVDDPSASSAFVPAQDEEQCRQFIVKNCIRGSGQSRYAIKRLRRDISRDPLQYPAGAMDLAIEALFLADLQHPNIIKLRGISTADPFAQDRHSSGNFYFLILDRLCDTLTGRMSKWAEKKRRLTSLLGRMTDISGSKRQCLLDERLAAAYDLSAAVAYLKTQKILHRDLKPDNIGFDIRGDIKIFDFGLARELRDSDKDLNNEGMFHLSNMTGSLRYMAPEVGVSGKTYNSTADVYSFTIVLWEMLSLKRAYMEIGPTQDSFIHSVFVKQTRPAIKHSWSRTLQSLLKQGWCHDPRKRLTAKQCQDRLRNELVNMRHGDDTDLDHIRRRSTYLMDEEERHSDDSGSRRGKRQRRSASTSDIHSILPSSQLPWTAKPTSSVSSI